MKFVSLSIERKVLLNFDLHKTHANSLELIGHAQINGLVLISLPPNTSHKFQSLDRNIFRPLKTLFNTECMKWMQKYLGMRVTVDKLGSLFNVAYLKFETLTNALSAFRTLGKFPFNPEIILEH